MTDELEKLREQNEIWARDARAAHGALNMAGAPQMESHADRVKWLLAEVRVLRERLWAARAGGSWRPQVAEMAPGFLTAMSEPVSAQDAVNIVADCVTDAGRLAWLRDMHTLHIRAEFVYTVGGYCLAITHDGNELETYEATEDAANPDLDACWRQVIDKAAAEWRNGKRIGDRK